MEPPLPLIIMKQRGNFALHLLLGRETVMSGADPAVARDDERRRERELSKSRLQVVLASDAEQNRIVHLDLRGEAFHIRGVVSSSIETPITTRPRDLYVLYNSMNPGISFRQGGHQVAQKSSRITLPL